MLGRTFARKFPSIFSNNPLERWWWIWNGWNVETTSNNQPISWAYPATQDATPWLKWMAKLWDLFFTWCFFLPPIWQVCSSNWGSFAPQFMEVIKKNMNKSLFNHLVLRYFYVFLSSAHCWISHILLFSPPKKNTPKNVGCPRNGTGIRGIIGTGPLTFGRTTWKIHRNKNALQFFMQLRNTWMFPKIVGFPPKSSILIGVFHYKPSILGYPYFWKHPHEEKTSTFFGTRVSIFGNKGVNCIQFKHMF